MMATVYEYNTPPIKNSAFTFYISLVSQADTDIFKTSVTLAAGDVTVHKDGGSAANIGTLPAEIASTGILAVALTSTEMNANSVVVRFSDAAGSEWQDAIVEIKTVQAVTVSGHTAADVWASATRTLTQSAASVVSTVSGSEITIKRGDTLTASLTDIGALTDYVSLDFMVKADKGDLDTAALIWIRKNASGTGDGLLYINSASAETAANGSITIDDEATGDITITLAASETDGLTPRKNLYYDVQMITATAVNTLTEEFASITADVTRAVT